MERHPRDNKTIILLANAGSANASIRAIRNILYDIENKPPVEIQLSNTLLEKYAGSYQFENGDTLKIRLSDGKLFISVMGGKENQLYAEAADLFFRKDRDDLRVKMIKGNDDVVSGLEILREGPPINAVRIQPEGHPAK